MRIGYGKVGRSMPLSLDKCGTLGGDVEMASVIKSLAERNPEHTFVLIGRNDGSNPVDVGLPSNIENPWIEWGPQLLRSKTQRGLTHSNLSIDEHRMLGGIYNDITLDTVMNLDGMVLWAGQHGTTNTPIPSVRSRGKFTKPHDWSAHYCSYLLHGVNQWRDVDPLSREEVWLNSDPRNYLKMRDLKWPLRHPILAQRNYTHNIKHERYNDGSGFDTWYCPERTWASSDTLGPWAVDVAEPDMHTSEIWRSIVSVKYSRLEVNGLVPGSPFGNLISYNDDWSGRKKFGLFTNEARKYVAVTKSRLTALREWVLPNNPDWVHGTWSVQSQEQLGREITPTPWNMYYPQLHSVRSTFAMPSYGNKWATTKVWEAFAAGTVCFMHAEYDDQNNILADAPAELSEWLRLRNPMELRTRINHLNTSTGRNDWEMLVRLQREHFDRAMSDLTYARLIEARLFSGE